jgi:predicted amidohydrolase
VDHLSLHLLSFDAGYAADSPSAFTDKVVELVHASWDDGADLVLLPELLWMGLERFVDQHDPVRGVASLFSDQLWPGLQISLSRPAKAVVLGTTPFCDGTGLRNRAPIIAAGRILHQDKIHLTPWESAFCGGGPLCLWTFRDVTIAVVICLDIEIPEISAALRGSGVDLILVPSATESMMGVERVGRCADARAVELGCHVALCHLCGLAESELIDQNLGRLAFFSPSQSLFTESPRRIASDVFSDGFHRLAVDVDIAAIRRNRHLAGETDPSKVSARMPEIIRSTGFPA